MSLDGDIPLSQDLVALSAVEAVRLLRRGEITPLDLIDAAEARTRAVDGAINALPIHCFDQARDAAASLNPLTARREAGWLAGLPIAVKDLSDVEGVRTTMGGSPIFKDRIATSSSYEVRNLLANGALPVAKATSPEFGFNATTYSQLFGYTRNPWNTALSTAGSSGGSAAALATGEVWLATGSDLGASIRAPAAFCGVVGLRPGPGLVPRGPATYSSTLLPVNGPMARSVADVALMLDAMVGHQPGDPLSFPPAVPSYQTDLDQDPARLRVGVSTDLGITRCDGEIAGLIRNAGRIFEGMGADVDEGCPDFAGAIEIFHTIRGTGHIAGMGKLIESHRELLTPEILWSVETARKHDADAIATAERERSALYARVAAFFETYDLLICPSTVVPPFPVEWTTVREHEGHVFERYIDWIAITFAITLTGCPAISVPCGFTAEGLPVGVQIVGRPRGEHALLQAAAAFERAAALGRLTPIDPRQP